MDTLQLMKEISKRSDGDVYLGVVGPVRSGKSTFIKRFMEVAVINNMEEGDEKRRAIDELPQSGDGKTIMTMEPKFIPSSAATIKIEDNFSIHVRLIDCVGFLIDSASGYIEDGKMRMVKTPWFDDEIPFDEAARIGTEKVIREHSTIGIVVLSDGTINDFAYEDYLSAETKVLQEVSQLDKPYVIVLNSKNPENEKAQEIKTKLEENYNVPVILCDVMHMDETKTEEILKSALDQFSINGIDLLMPTWVSSLMESHPLRMSLQSSIDNAMNEAFTIKDVEKINELIAQNENITSSKITDLDMGSGLVTIQIDVKEGLYEQVLHDLVGCEISDKGQLIAVLSEYAETKKNLEFISNAIKMAKMSNYGFAAADPSEMVIEKPCVMKQGSRYGIKVKATMPTYHIIKVDVETSFEPVLGSKEQAEFFVNYLLENYEKDPLSIMDCEMFGRKFKDIINQGITLKLDNLPDNIKVKLQQLIKTISNKGKTNLIAFVF